MGREKFAILVVEDQEVNRQILRQILQGEYDILEAENGLEALAVLEKHKGISAILLDIFMPVMDGYTFLQHKQQSAFAALPVIAVTAGNDETTEQKALDLGAWDFVPKPYHANILLLRLKNVIVRSQFYLIREMQYVYEHDPLTGLYNRTRFFMSTHKMLQYHTEQRFALVRFDIDNFHIYNTFWGEEEGDRLLCFLAELLRRMSQTVELCTYGRISGDVFCICEPYDETIIRQQVEHACHELAHYNQEYLIEPIFGIYMITDIEERIESMYESATIAAKECQGQYRTCLRYYQPEMNQRILQEQTITNQMQHALDNREFVLYLQPKYNLKTEQPYGAEALIRWQHPEKGLLMPGTFIPVFERNGFIGKVDYYMWESACQLLHRWIKEGKSVAPISVNMSRVNLHNPNLVQLLTDLIAKYQVPPHLLNLELTESAYMDNPTVMEKTVLALQDAGFTIMMDDFGSGYSSLNTLKNIPVNVLKIDMKFLSGDSDTVRNKCILTSVIRMAGWLAIPVIMEGVETRKQVEFLKSIGCGYVQGYYFAKPMPVADYESLVAGCNQSPVESLSDNNDLISATIWSTDPHIDLLFNSIKQPAAVYEYENNSFHALRVNTSYNHFFGYGEVIGENLEQTYCRQLSRDALKVVLAALRQTAESKQETVCTYPVQTEDGTTKMLQMDLQYWGTNENAKVIFALFTELSRETNACDAP